MLLLRLMEPLPARPGSPADTLQALLYAGLTTRLYVLTTEPAE